MILADKTVSGTTTARREKHFVRPVLKKVTTLRDGHFARRVTIGLKFYGMIPACLDAKRRGSCFYSPLLCCSVYLVLETTDGDGGLSRQARRV